MDEFVEKYAERIICQPSGMPYTELKNQTIEEVTTIKTDTDKYEEIVSIIDNMV